MNWSSAILKGNIKMNTEDLKKYKFCYLMYEHLVHKDSKEPYMVFEKENPNKNVYKKVTNPESLTKAEWVKEIEAQCNSKIKYITAQISNLNRDIRHHRKTINGFKMKLPILQNEIKEYEEKGVYTYLTLKRD